MFDTFDADGGGSIDADELRAAMKVICRGCSVPAERHPGHDLVPREIH